MPRRSWLAPLVLVVAFSRSSWAQSQPPAAEPPASDAAKAEQLFEKGLSDMRAGRYDTGCPALAESYELDPLPGALFTLAECQTRWGKIASGLAHYKEFLAIHEKMTPAEKAEQKERVKVAEEQVRALEPVVPTLTVKLAPGTPANARVSHNGEPVASLGTPMTVDPGEHIIKVEVPGRPAHTETVVVTRAEKRQVVVKLPPLQKTDPDDDDDDDDDGKPLALDRDALCIGAIVASAVGGAGGIVSVVTGAVTLSHKNTIEDNCNGIACNQEGKDAADNAQVTGVVSTVGFVVGAAGLATAVVLWVLYATTDGDQPRTEQADVGVTLRPGGLALQW